MNSFDFVPIDVIFVLLILFLTIRCIARGFVAEFITVSSVVGGIIAGFLFSSILTNYVAKYFNISWWNRIISFLIIFLVVYIILKLLERIFYKIIDKINLERLDRSLGLFFGLLEGVVIVLFIVTVLDAQPFFPTDKILQGSIITDIARKILLIIPDKNIMNVPDLI